MAKGHNKRTWQRRVLRIVGIALAIPLGLLLVALAFLHSGPGQRLVRDKIVTRIGERLNGRFELAELSFTLGGDITLGGVKIIDEQGKVIVALASLKVSPAWRELMGGTIAIDEIALDGLSLALSEDEKGVLDIKTLFKPTPPKPPSPPTKKEPRHIVVRKLHIGDVALTVDKADGTRIAIDEVGIDGTIDAVPDTKTATVRLSLGANFKLQKKLDGLTVAVTGIATGVSVDMKDGVGTLAVTPTKAQARISQDGFRDREIMLDLDGISVDVNPGTLAATVQKLALGALVVQSLELSGGAGDEGLSGEQRVQLVGLHVDAARLNELLQRKLLASDVDIATKLSGPPERIVLETDVVTAGGRIDLDGVIDASSPAHPHYDLSLVMSDIATAQLLAGDTIPPVTIDRVRVGVRGGGRTKEAAEIDLGVHVAGVKVKQYVVDDVVVEARYDGSQIHLDPLRISAYGHEVIVRGWIDVTRKLVDAHLTMVGDVGRTLARLREGGVAIKTDLPRQLIVLGEDTVTVDIKGNIEGALVADVAIHNLAIAGGGVFATAHADLFRNVDAGPDDKKVELRDLDAVVELRAINLKQALALRGKKLDGLTGLVSAKIVVDDAPQQPTVDYRIEARVQPSDAARIDVDKPVLVAVAKGHATKNGATLRLDVTGQDGASRFELIQADANIPLIVSDEHKGIAPYRPLHVALKIPDAPLRELARYVPERLLLDKNGKPREIPRGSVDLEVAIDGTAAAPKGTIALDVQARLHPLRKQRIKLDGTISNAPPSRQPKVKIDTELGVWADAGEAQTLKGRIGAELSRSPLLPGHKDIDWWLDLDVLPQKLDDWLELRVMGLSGVAKGGIHLKGNASDVTGTIDVDVEDFRRDKLGPFDVHIGVGIDPNKTAVDLSAKVFGVKVMRIEGDVARPGVALLAALRDKTPGKSLVDKLGDPAIDLRVTVPGHEPKTWAFVRPDLEKLPGEFGGEFHLTGTLATPLAKGEIGYRHFETLRGGDGRAVLVVDASADNVHAAIELGARQGDKAVSIDADVPRGAIKPYLDAKACWSADKPSDCSAGVTLPISARVAAHGVDIEDLVPKFAVEGVPVKFDGTLNWDLDGHIVLDPKPRFSAEGTKLPPLSPDSTLEGKLTITDGLISLPGTSRQYTDAQIVIRHGLQGVDVDQISLRESTEDNPDRNIAIKAHLALDHLKPGKLTAHVSARDWLVYGNDKVGTIDAPWGDLTADIKAEGDLGRPIKKIDITVDKLELLVPERFHRAHQPTHVSLGDVIHLGRGSDTPGKLPVLPKPPPYVPPDPKADTGLDLVVHIPKPGHILLQSMDLQPVGTIVVTRRGEGRDISGKLDMVGGHLELGGVKHALVRGNLYFSAPDCLGGCLDLSFAKKPHDAALRDVSSASAGDAVTIHLGGPLSDRVATLGGASSPGTLFDLLSVHNAGRQRYVAQPDMPASASAQYPQYNNLLLISYLAVNAPHLLFMDKVAAWSDAYDGRGTDSYGQLRHFEVEGYDADGDFRVRATTRPEAAGQSEAELSFDWLWAHDAQTAFGVGINAGDRLGGGPGIFLEWSSKD